MQLTVSTTINAPRSEVFTAFCDLDACVARMQAITAIEHVSGPTEFGIGTRWRETRKMMGREETQEMEVTAIAHESSYRVEANAHGTEYVTDFTFTDADGGTQVTMTFGGTPRTLAAKLMAPLGVLLKRSMRTALQQDLEDMKSALER